MSTASRNTVVLLLVFFDSIRECACVCVCVYLCVFGDHIIHKTLMTLLGIYTFAFDLKIFAPEVLADICAVYLMSCLSKYSIRPHIHTHIPRSIKPNYKKGENDWKNGFKKHRA